MTSTTSVAEDLRLAPADVVKKATIILVLEFKHLHFWPIGRCYGLCLQFTTHAKKRKKEKKKKKTCSSPWVRYHCHPA
jgi:hypothetical protein